MKDSTSMKLRQLQAAGKSNLLLTTGGYTTLTISATCNITYDAGSRNKLSKRCHTNPVCSFQSMLQTYNYRSFLG